MSKRHHRYDADRALPPHLKGIDRGLAVEIPVLIIPWRDDARDRKPVGQTSGQRKVIDQVANDGRNPQREDRRV